MAAGHRLNCPALAAEEDGAQGEEVVRFVHTSIRSLGLKGDGMEGLGGNDPSLMLLQKLGVGPSGSTVLLDYPSSDGPRHPPWAVVGRRGIIYVTILLVGAMDGGFGVKVAFMH